MTRMAYLIAAFCLAVSSIASAGVPIVLKGSDYLETPGAAFGGVPFHGVPTGPGNTDTIEKRLADAVSGVPIPTELVALTLVSTSPTDFGLGVDFYYMTLQSARGGPSTTGNMTILIGSPDDGLPLTPEGTFSSFFDVFFDIRKGGSSGPIALSDTLALTSSGTPWDATPTPLQLLVTGLVGDGLANFHTNKTADQMDFFPSQTLRTFPTGAFILDEPTTTAVPEPATVVLMTTGLLGLSSRRRAQRRDRRQ